jgi:hypothetical protein
VFGGIARHVIGAGIAWAVFTVQSGVIYLGLLAYALIADADTGGPLAGPLLILIAAVVGAGLVPLLFVPSVALGEAAGRRGRAARLPVTVGTAALLAAVYVGGVCAVTDVALTDSAVAWLVGLLTLLAPLSAYAAVVYGGPAVWRRLSRVRRPDVAAVSS